MHLNLAKLSLYGRAIKRGLWAVFNLSICGAPPATPLGLLGGLGHIRTTGSTPYSLEYGGTEGLLAYGFKGLIKPPPAYGWHPSLGGGFINPLKGAPPLQPFWGWSRGGIYAAERHANLALLSLDAFMALP